MGVIDLNNFVFNPKLGLVIKSLHLLVLVTWLRKHGPQNLWLICDAPYQKEIHCHWWRMLLVGKDDLFELKHTAYQQIHHQGKFSVLKISEGKNKKSNIKFTQPAFSTNIILRYPSISLPLPWPVNLRSSRQSVVSGISITPRTSRIRVKKNWINIKVSLSHVFLWNWNCDFNFNWNRQSTFSKLQHHPTTVNSTTPIITP